MLDQPRPAADHRRPLVLASACALARLDAGERGLRHGEDSGDSDDATTRDDDDRVSPSDVASPRSLARVEAVEQLALALAAWPPPRRSSAWSMPEHVQDAVHDEQRDLVVVGAGVGRARCAAATSGQMTTSPSSERQLVGSTRWRPGPVRPMSGDRPPSTSVVVDREGEHVGGALLAQEPLLRSAMDASSTNSIDSSASPRMPSALEHLFGQRAPSACRVDGRLGLLVGRDTSTSPPRAPAPRSTAAGPVARARS